MIMKAYDIHSHYNHNVEGDTKTDELYRCDVSFLIEERKRLGISCMAACSFASVLNKNSIFDENNHCFQLALKNDFIYQWVVIDPQDKRTYEQANNMMASNKCLGIKIHSIYHGYNILDYVDEMFCYANEHHLTVLMHPDHILEVAEIADKYPHMNLIIAHIGSLDHINAIKNAKNGNIYTDTSGVASSNNNIIEYAVKEIGSNKILFGTDTYSAAFQLGRILLANISEVDKNNILFKNAKKLFKGKL